jgi:hypothetical protein
MRWISVVACLSLAAPAFAAPESFFGQDLNPGTDGDNTGPLASHPNSDAARAAFYERLVGVATEDFEAQTTNAATPFALNFGADTATIYGTATIADSFYSGHYAISGTKYLDVGHDANPKSFHVDFSTPQSAFGFYLTDLGDAGARILVTLHHATGPDVDITPPSVVDDVKAQASVLYFGVIDADDPFTSVTISREPLTATDGFGFDDMVVARAASVVPVPTVDSFFLPTSVVYKPNAAKPANGTFVAAGVFDTGSTDVDLSAAATLTVGGHSFGSQPLVPSPNHRTFTYAQGGAKLVVTKNAYGSSRGTFKLTFKGDLGAGVPTTGQVELKFQNAAVSGRCVVLLTRGVYKLGKVRGALSEPNLFLSRAKAAVPGGGKDSLSIVVGLASGGVTPATAPDVRVQFGSGVFAAIPGASFTKKGDKFTFKGNVNGIVGVTLDYARETMTIVGKGLYLGAFAQGGNPVRIVVGLGAETHGVVVRMARKGNALKY